MNRILILALGVGLTTGCTVTAYDGTYLVFSTMVTNTANPDDPNIGKEERTLGTVATTKEGTLVMNWDGVLMIGEMGDKKSFSVGRESGTDYSGEGCSVRVSKEDIECDGLFTKDGGITADVKYTDKLTINGCDGWDDTDETYEWKWELTGVQINANDGSHLGDDANWGYTPTPVY